MKKRPASTMLARSTTDRLRQALGGYFYAFIPMLFGIILLATGIQSSIEHLTGRLDTAHAFAFGGGVGLLSDRDSDLPKGFGHPWSHLQVRSRLSCGADQSYWH